MNLKSYEKPEVLPGDLIECLETGGRGIISEFGSSHESHPISWAIVPLPGARIKCAWWRREEFKVLEKGPAHAYWAEALLVQKAQDEERARRRDIDWVIANWDTVVGPLMDLDIVRTILCAADLLPDQLGLLSKGEIGIAALQLFEIYQTYQDDIAEAMTDDEPKAALWALGVQVKAKTEQ
jgi:hypothetical protein